MSIKLAGQYSLENICKFFKNKITHKKYEKIFSNYIRNYYTAKFLWRAERRKLNSQ